MNLIEVVRNNKKILIFTDLDLAAFYEVSQERIKEARKKLGHKIKSECFLVRKKDNLSDKVSNLLGEKSPYYAFTLKGAYLLSFQVDSKKAEDVSKEVMQWFSSVADLLFYNNHLKPYLHFAKDYASLVIFNQPVKYKVTTSNQAVRALKLVAKNGYDSSRALRLLRMGLPKNPLIDELNRLATRAIKDRSKVVYQIIPVLLWLYS